MSSYQKYFPSKINLFEDGILVYLVELNLLNTEEFMPFLSEDEKNRAERLKVEKKKNQFIITRGLLRNLISACLLETKPEEVHFFYAEHGKPGINNKFYNKPIEFNVSHSGDYALLALTLEHRLGVDIEEVNPSIEYLSLGKRFFSPNEIEQLERYDASKRLDAFYRCWARKESFIKAEGSGVAFGLDKFSVSLDEEKKCNEITFDETSDIDGNWFTYESITVPDYKTAIAANKDDLQLITHVITN